MGTISSRIELQLFLYLRLQAKRSQHLGNGEYVLHERPTLVHLLNLLGIDYSHRPGKGRIYFKWEDCTHFVDEILAPEYSRLAYESIGASLPVEIRSEYEYRLLSLLFSLHGGQMAITERSGKTYIG